MAEIILEKKPEPARLRIYIGAAPGVGKTFEMLNDAYLMRHQGGVDLVLGLVETHGRKETADQIRDLELVPLKVIPYRGVNLKEMDVDAIIARHPQTVVVDELAHTNVPGSKNRKRYEDVLELLDAGINVMTAVNIQHLETLNDAVNRSANTTIRETVPDSFVKRADEVVNVDLTVEELRNRLRAGKIYAPEKVEQSLANFFRKGNLNMLRELSLRTTAEQVGSRASEYRRTQGLEQAPIPEKVMVCLSTQARNGEAAAHRRENRRTAGDELVRSLCNAAGRQRPQRPGSAPASGRVHAHGARSWRQSGSTHRPQSRRRADPLCAAGKHLARGVRAIGAIAVRHSSARLGAQPVSVRGA